jgi:hypothetical protein
MQLANSRAFYLSLLLAGSGLTGCHRASGPDITAEITRLSGELEGTKQKLAATEKDLESKKDAATQAEGIAEAVKKQLAEKEQAAAQSEAQIRALQTELANLKRGDAARFAEASATQQKGVASISLDHYQQFVRDFPTSPMVVDANRAITEFTAAANKDSKWRESVIDPKKQERELLDRLNDGVLTAAEIAPLLRNRSTADVIKLMGRPSSSFRDGTEIGYVDKVIDATTGQKGTLIIKFESGTVSTLRVGYQGREIRP